MTYACRTPTANSSHKRIRNKAKIYCLPLWVNCSSLWDHYSQKFPLLVVLQQYAIHPLGPLPHTHTHIIVWHTLVGHRQKVLPTVSSSHTRTRNKAKIYFLPLWDHCLRLWDHYSQAFLLLVVLQQYAIHPHTHTRTDTHTEKRENCLLYTSPSPRDRG